MEELRSIRPLSAESLRGVKLAAVAGKLPRCELVSPQSIFVEDDYQRDIGSERSISLIRKMCAAWNWSRFKPPICVRLPDSGNALVAVDGQHTATAAACLSIPKIPVMVVTAADVAERAQSFVGHNRDRLNLTPMAIYRAQVVAGDPVALTVERACIAAGCRVASHYVSASSAPETRRNRTIAVGALRTIAKTRGEDALTRVLKVMVASARAPFSSEEIAAAALTLDDAPKAVDAKLARCIAGKTESEWKALVSAATIERNAARAILLADLWRAELGLSATGRSVKQSGSHVEGALSMPRPAKPAPAPKAEKVPAALTSNASPPPKVEPTTAPAAQSNGGIRLDVRRQTLTRNGNKIAVTDQETRALLLLLKVMPAVIPYDRLAEKAFGSDVGAAANVRTLIQQLNEPERLPSLNLAVRELRKMGVALSDA